MGNQYETLIPSKLHHITLFFHRTNNSEPKSRTGFNASIYDNTINYFCVDIAYLHMVNKWE